MKENISRCLHLDDAPSAAALKKQIFSLLINFTLQQKANATKYIHTRVFERILNVFPNLQYFNFDLSSNSFRRLSFYVSPPTVISSTLLELHISLRNFDDCLYLLDGRFNRLRAFYVRFYLITSSNAIVNNEVSYF